MQAEKNDIFLEKLKDRLDLADYQKAGLLGVERFDLLMKITSGKNR